MSSVPQSGLSQHDPRGRLIDTLRRQLGRWGSLAGAEDAPVFSCGTAAIDRLLPGGGLRHGMLVEWVGKKEQQSSRTAEKKWLPLFCSSALLLFHCDAQLAERPRGLSGRRRAGGHRSATNFLSAGGRGLGN
jgi:hypothetical protein